MQENEKILIDTLSVYIKDGLLSKEDLMETLVKYLKENKSSLIRVSRIILEEILIKYSNTEKLKITLPPKLLENLIFVRKNINGDCYLEPAFDFNLIKKLDLTNASFDNVDIRCLDFTGSYGVVLDPQKVYQKSVIKTILASTKIVGDFDDVIVTFADFTRSHGAKIKPEKVASKDLSYTKLCDVEFTGTFDNCNIIGSDFTGSRGAVINPQTIHNKDLSHTVLSDAEVIDALLDVNTSTTDFTNCKLIGALPNTPLDGGKIPNRLIKIRDRLFHSHK